MNQQQLLMLFKDISTEELTLLNNLLLQMNENQKNQFLILYKGRRKEAVPVLLMALLGFVAIAGVHRFYLGQIGWGIVYLITGGFFGIGTLVDVIRHKKITFNHNQEQAMDSARLVSNFVK